MNQDVARDEVIKSIEIEASALSRVVSSILKTLTEEQKQFICKDLEQISLMLTSEIDSSKVALHKREQQIREHAMMLVQHKHGS